MRREAARTLRSLSRAYQRDLERYCVWCDVHGLVSVADIRENDVADFAASLRQQEGERPPLSPSSAARTMVSVRTFHAFAAREGLAPDNPAKHVQPTALPKRRGVLIWCCWSTACRWC